MYGIIFMCYTLIVHSMQCMLSKTFLYLIARARATLVRMYYTVLYIRSHAHYVFFMKMADNSYTVKNGMNGELTKDSSRKFKIIIALTPIQV